MITRVVVHYCRYQQLSPENTTKASASPNIPSSQALPMQFLQSLLFFAKTAALRLAATISRYEVEILHIPPSLCFFTPDEFEEEIYLQVFILSAGFFMSLVVNPLCDAFLDEEMSQLLDHGPIWYTTSFLKCLICAWIYHIFVRIRSIMITKVLIEWQLRRLLHPDIWLVPFLEQFSS